MSIYSKVKSFLLIFLTSIVILRLFAYFGKKIDFQNQINLVNGGQIPELPLLIFILAVSLPIAVIIFWPILIKADKIHLNLPRPIELTRWRVAGAVSAFELLVMVVVVL
jgi:hypothetical protein